MRWSQLFIPTLRESPAEAESANCQLLLRAGYIRQSAPGVYSYLFLAQRSLLKIMKIVRAEMAAIAGQELLLPGEGVLASLARELRSYKQLPQTWYQIQTKFRDDTRPRSSLLGSRHLIMTESCSLDIDGAGRELAYQRHHDAYRRVLDRCGLDNRVLSSGTDSHDFMVESEAGGDCMALCAKCGYAANGDMAAAHSASPRAADPEGELTPEAFHTPGRKTIADVSEFTGRPATSQIKSLVMVANGELLLALVRGDHQLSKTKIAAVAGHGDVRPARPEEIRAAFGADAGSLGPVGVSRIRILADEALKGRRNMIAGANKDDYHLRHVTPGEDFPAEFHDLRKVEAGDGCIACGAPLEIRAAIELGRLRKSGPGCAESLGLHVTNREGEEVLPAIGSYELCIERILAAVIELNHDPDGMILPVSIAPFTAVITPVHIGDTAQRNAAEEVYGTCKAIGLDTLLDDRDERPGVKFKDADLIGVPFRITVGKKAGAGTVELIERRGRKSTDVPVAEAAVAVAARVRGI
jgi:prolyl-tRNA synthetase